MSGLAFKLGDLLEHLIMMGRNSRWPTKSNHGSRPNSSVMRRMRKIGFYQRPRNETTLGVELASDDEYEGVGEGDDAEEEQKAEGTEEVKEEGKEQTDKQGGKQDQKAGKADSNAGKDQKSGKGAQQAGKVEAKEPASAGKGKGKK